MRVVFTRPGAIVIPNLDDEYQPFKNTITIQDLARAIPPRKPGAPILGIGAIPWRPDRECFPNPDDFQVSGLSISRHIFLFRSVSLIRCFTIAVFRRLRWRSLPTI